MKPFFSLLTLSILIFIACSKDKFPDEFSIYGRWREITSDSVRTDLEFKRHNVLMIKYRQDTIPSEYRYQMNKVNELEIFKIAEFPNGLRTTHRITYNRKFDQITIYNLYPATPDISPTITFARR